MINKMMKPLCLGAVTIALAFAVGCASKKTAADSAADASGGSDTAIESTPMSFDAAGSDSGSIQGLSSINFEYDRATLTSSAKKKIQANVDWMKGNQAKVQVEGHCDSRGSIEYNLSLGERRAKAVKDYMVSLGMSSDRLSIISYGKEKPLDDGDSEAAFTKNRRANFMPLQ